MLLTFQPLVGYNSMRLLFGVSFLIVSYILTITILITLAVATSIASRTSGGAQVGDTIENHAEDLGAGAVHQVDRVAGLLTGGFILAGDEHTVVGIITDQSGIVEHPDRRGIENQDVKLLLEARYQLIHARVFENATGMSGRTTGRE